MRRPGLTLIETVLSLALLASVAVAVAALLSIASAATASASKTGRGGTFARDDRAINAAVRLISDDLRFGDFAVVGGDPRVAIDDHGRLAVATRDRGVVQRTYRHDVHGERLVVEETAVGGTRVRTLVGAVESWSVVLDAEQTLIVEWIVDGRAGSRRWRLP